MRKTSNTAIVGKHYFQTDILMAQNLVIVESPAKAKTIEKFLGKDFVVKSSFGHIRDLPSKGMNIDIENGFAPHYEINTDKKKVVNELKKIAKESTVWLASDEDREGEAIAWHLAEALHLDPKKTKRITFHEITKPAILKAIENPRVINKDLVDAQQARRVLDRLVGYEISPILWKKIRTGLSAGRVQSVAVRLIVEREEEIRKFDSKSSFKVMAEFDLKDGKVLKAELKKKIPTIEKAQTFLETIKDASFQISDIITKPGKRTPAAPFTTSTLQQEASRKLGFSVKQTMTVAQKLYESGKITYMRTDSMNLSETAISQIESEVKTEFGKEYFQKRVFKTKSSTAQEAHEAIRPTDTSKRDQGSDSNEKRLYELIWKRTVASQMADALLEKTVVHIDISTHESQLVAEGEVIQFPGFLEVYIESSDDEDDNALEKNILPPLAKNQILPLKTLQAKEGFDRSPPRYTEASLVKKMEEMGIGRPSTYAPTISTIQDRGYIEKKSTEGTKRHYAFLVLKKGAIINEEKTETTGAEKNKLFPTDTGKVVNEFLMRCFPTILDYHFTAKVEEEFDAIAHGKERWNRMIQEFYTPFHASVEETGEISRSEISYAREVGIDPKTKKPIFARIGRFGPMLQLGETESEEKPRFASIPKDVSIDDITLEQALPLFELPRVIGKTKDGTEITAQIGRFGPYIKHDKTFVSIQETELFDITLEEAEKRINEKKEEAQNRIIHDFTEKGIQVLKGRYGPYITDGKKNAKIPKDKAPESLTQKECEDLLSKAPDRKKRGFVRKTKK